MGTTAQKLQAILDSKEAIRQAINNKGVQVTTGDTLSTYASKIDAISTGSTVVVKDYLVRFFDYDGTILKEQWVYSGETATAPSTPNHQYLTFAEWNNTFTGVTEDIDTGALYNTTDGKSYLFITLTPAMSGTTPTLYFNKSTTSLMTIDWGDGTTSTSTTSGNQNISHTYSTYGSYIITVDNPNGGTYTFGNATSTTQIFSNGSYSGCLNKLYLGSTLSALNQYSINTSTSLSSVSIPTHQLTHSSAYISVFGSCYNLKAVILNKTHTMLHNSYFTACVNLVTVIAPKAQSVSIGTFVFNACGNLENLFLKNTSTSIGTSSFNGCGAISKITIPSNITSIGNTTFQNNYNCCCYLCYPTTPPTLGTTSFLNINSLAKIYVPDASVNAYKTATGWVEYANFIYPISTYTP